MQFTDCELALILELVSDARQSLPDPDDIPEPGSYANQIALLEIKLNQQHTFNS